MAAPLAIPLVGKLGLALKGLMGAGKAAGAAKAATGIGANIKAAGIGAARAAASRGGANGLSFGGIKRFAGKALQDYMGPDDIPMIQKLGMNFGPDAFFGVMQGAMTPGDLGDKLIAGTTTAVGGAMGGVGAVGLIPGAKTNPAMRMMAEFGGGYAGDMVGQMVGDTVLRAKGGGTTPWEKLQQEGDQQYRQQLEREVLAQYGVGGYNVPDLFMQDNGFA